jgi:hypothetical protein
MKISHLTGFITTFCFAILLLTQTASAQTTSCDDRYGYGGGPICCFLSLDQRLDIACNTTPADHNITQGTGEGFRAICKDCVPLDYGPTRAYTGALRQPRVQLG